MGLPQTPPRTLDPRLRESPIVFLAGAAVLACVSAACAALFVSGLLSGAAMRAPARRNWTGWLHVYDNLADSPWIYAFDLVGWGLLLVMSGAGARICGWFYATSGGIFGTPDEKALRRIGRYRRAIDAGVFASLRQHVPGHWRSVRLELESQLRQGKERLRCRVSNLEGHTDAVPLGVSFDEMLDRLLDVFQKHGQGFRRSVYAMDRDEKGRWKLTLSVD